MRWDALFSDLEAQVSAQQAQQLEAEVAEALELERSRMSLADRMRAGVGQEMQICLPGQPQLRLHLESVGTDWLGGHLGGEGLLVRLEAVRSAEGLAGRGQPELSRARQRSGIGAPLRSLARSRETVVIHGVEGELGRGRIVHVGADHLDLAVQSREAGPSGRGPQLRSIALAAVVTVRSC